MERWFGVLLCVFALTAAGEDQSTRGGSKAESIGTATMTADRTIILDLRALAPDGTVGDARLTYPKSHKDYAAILKHLGIDYAFLHGFSSSSSKKSKRMPASARTLAFADSST